MGIITIVAKPLTLKLLVTLLAILASHAIAMPLSPGFPAHELQYIMDQSEASLCLTSQKFQDKAREIVKEGLKHDPTFVTIDKLTESKVGRDEIKLDDVATDEGGMMLYTSGTTSRPVSRLFASQPCSGPR